MKNIFFLLQLLAFSKWTITHNLTEPELRNQYAEQALSSELEEVDSRSGGWSKWSEWSPCSRSCDGGVSKQIRSCKTTSCRGEHVRYRICNMQACPDSRDFRMDQCQAFNKSPYKGLFYEWTPHYEDEKPCTLTCVGSPVSENEITQDHHQVVVITNLADKVHDGTRCRPGSLDMCIDGICQKVGCDLRIGSSKQIDECGVCGGDGSSCFKPIYHWTLTFTSLCSKTCGGGFKMSRPVCQNRVTGEEVESELCNDSQKPDATVVRCNIHSCPPKWHVGEWGTCSSNCGGGTKLREVYCVEEVNNTKIRVNNNKCSTPMPWEEENCSEIPCPSWHTSSWSGCSVSCGEGVQVRVVECRASDQETTSTMCDLGLKPPATKPCFTGIQCPYHSESNLDSSEELLTSKYYSQPLVQPPPPPTAERLIGEIIPSESSFIPDEWGPCSVSCGEGVRKREVHCKIFLEFSRTIAKLPDKQCSGEKPIEIEKCFMEPCSSERIGIDIKDDPYRSDIKVAGGLPGKSYSWREQGYTHCSATCLGGVQELIVNCVRDDTQKVTSPYMCPIELKPEILMRTCNDHPCPPRWNFSEFSPCSQSCGIGIQTREVSCIHEVTQGGGNTVVVPNNMCPQPPPPDRQYCNVLDCPVRWKVHEWSKCSKSCGTGEKTRKVECKQVMAQNHTVDRLDSKCPHPKPQERKPCNTKSCIVESDRPQIDVSNSTFIQHDPKKKKISLKIGGAATVFLGTTVKIKCPVKRFNRTKIQWAKDKNYIPKSKKYKTSRKGALRIQNLTLRDSGLYTCIAGKSTASIQISVRPKPGRDDPNPIFSDEHSHEQRPDKPKRKTTPRTKLFTPTLPSLRLDTSSKTDAHMTSSAKDPDRTVNLPPSSSESLNPVFEDTPSSASRNMPHFQKLISNIQNLWLFQMFSNSRGHRMMVDTFPTSLFSELEPNMVLTIETKKNYTWKTSEWSKCSETCGNSGYQIRKIACVYREDNATYEVDPDFCEKDFLEKPETKRRCSLGECPTWKVTDWNSCESAKCVGHHEALQKRAVLCQTSKNITYEKSKCNKRQRPLETQICLNEKCVGSWQPGNWTECAAACEMKGVQHRTLRCVWDGTDKPAGMVCRDIKRPPVIQLCTGPPCNSIKKTCKDHSKFCLNVKLTNRCRIMRYQQQCCRTCSL
ncbi:ADAMTS-like protein 1 isoform X3 [Aethina tumida]|uniref:ADAMTS-like protein 1 isoform X3 n=1 Tax=Aethina tumida TaxID=116153 RepID=UPI002147DCAC|nr:ADAMTS-like protein 1 isoform X3 [Aethina tumida]